MLSYSIDVLGIMAETNSGWQHYHLQSAFKQCLRRQLKFGKAVFASPSPSVDALGGKETFQAGGLTVVIHGNLTTTVFGTASTDSTGLGRNCGFTLIGQQEKKLSVITGYRMYASSIAAATLGCTFNR
jgi:hypothetical protein